MKTLKTVSLLILALMMAGPLFAQTPPPPKPKKMAHPKHMERKGMMGQLNLTKDQQDKIKKIRLDMMEAMTPLRNKMQEKRAQLQTSTTGENADFSKAGSVIDDMANLRAQMMKKGLQAKKQVRDLLTEEQRIKFDARHGFMGMGHGKKTGHHLSGPPRPGRNH